MKTILTTAYDMQGFQISGPPWLDTERYDIAVKVPVGASKDQVRAMWRNLLADRFGMKVRQESKEFRVLELTIAKGGSRLRQSKDDPGAPVVEGPPKIENGKLNGPGLMTSLEMHENGPQARSIARSQPLSKLTAMLGSQLETPVLDRTGLVGVYDFELQFIPNMKRAEIPGAAGVASETDLPSAVQEQLGLKLVAAKATLDVVVVEKMEKLPSAN